MPAVEPTEQNFKQSYVINASAKWYGLNGLDDEGMANEPPIWLHYNRYVLIGGAGSRAQRLVDAFGLVDGDSIGIIGSGFGWVAEKLGELLPTSEIIANDTSPWIQSAKDTTEEAEIIAACNLAGITDPARQAVWVSRFGGNVARTSANVTLYDYDLTNGGDRNKFLNEIAGNTFTWGITEDVLPWLTDNEIGVLSTHMNNLCDNVGHYVTEFSQEQADLGPGPEPAPLHNWHTLAEYKAMMSNDTFYGVHSKQVL